MKRKLLLISILFTSYSYHSYCQEPTRGYIEHAVPPFDNETKDLDWSKVEYKPILLYKPEQKNQEQNNLNKGGGTPGINVVTDNTDVQVFPGSVAQSEQHMTLSKVNPLNLILCSNTTQYEGYYVSQDGGSTWFGSNGMPDGVGTYGDPTTAVDGAGNLFIEAMNNLGPTGYKVFKSTNKGTTWGSPVSSTYSPVSFDKEMMAIDNLHGSPYYGNIYTAWTDFTGNYSVLFNRSINGGTSYTSNLTLHAGWGQGTNVQTGTEGQVYVCWANYGTGTYPANGIGFSRSTNGGSSFTELTPAFAYNGIRVSGTNPIFNNTRVNDFPSMAVDKSCGPFRGRIYIAYAGHQGGTTSAKGVIYVRYSDNQGTTWSAATEVSISTGRQNWFPWITVDDATGTVSVAYLTFDTPSGFITNTYLAYSFNWGFSWSNIKVSDVGHTVASIPGFATGYCGDYIANTAYGNKNYVCWNDDRTGQWQNYVSRIDFDKPAVYSSNTDLNLNGPVNHILPYSGDIDYEATNNINSPIGSTFTIQAGANVEMRAEGHIILNPGFDAKSGSHYDAAIVTVSGCINTVNRDGVIDEIEEHEKLLKPAYSGDATVQFSCYPNPANNTITFEYLVTERSDVTLILTDLQGREVKRLLNNVTIEPGLEKNSYDISALPSGVYTYKLVTGNYVKTGKFTRID
ncbi:MAG: T9SS type A sorting domain-containing protein [Bacteroidia bacterium]